MRAAPRTRREQARCLRGDDNWGRGRRKAGVWWVAFETTRVTESGVSSSVPAWARLFDPDGRALSDLCSDDECRSAMYWMRVEEVGESIYGPGERSRAFLMVFCHGLRSKSTLKFFQDNSCPIVIDRSVGLRMLYMASYRRRREHIVS